MGTSNKPTKEFLLCSQKQFYIFLRPQPHKNSFYRCLQVVFSRNYLFPTRHGWTYLHMPVLLVMQSTTEQTNEVEFLIKFLCRHFFLFFLFWDNKNKTSYIKHNYIQKWEATKKQPTRIAIYDSVVQGYGFTYIFSLPQAY